MNDLKKALQLKNALLYFIDLLEHDEILSDDDYQTYRKYFIEKYLEYVPEFLKECRTLADFINKLREVASGGGSWQARREFIQRSFKSFLDFLEFGDLSKNFEASQYTEGIIRLHLEKKVFNHVRRLLQNGHYFNAVEESFKIVREKLKAITGEEQAHKAFSEKNYTLIFGHSPKTQIEKDFFEGVKFLHMAIQKLRNEKAHTPARRIDKNLALHYIVLASLAYDLINRST